MGVVVNGMLLVEANGSPQPVEQMTTTDNKRHDASFSPWSREGTNDFEVMPYGVETGGKAIPAVSGSNDVIDIAAMSLVMPGANAADANGRVAVGAQTDVSVTRPAGNDYQISSITVDTDGNVVVIAGTASTAFATGRGDAGGPPYIPDGSVEVGQIYYMSQTPAAVTVDEIRQIPGESQELTAQPVITKTSSLEGYIEFSQALPNIHTGDIPKRVYLKGSQAILAEQKNVRDFVPPEQGHTLNSQAYYDEAKGSVTREAQQGTYIAALDDGVTDWIIGRVDKNVVVAFYPDRDKGAHWLCQGILGKTSTYPVDGQIEGNFTISAVEPAIAVTA